MNFNDQNRYCHAERSEASLCPSSQTLRCAQGDKIVPILLVKNHNRPLRVALVKDHYRTSMSLIHYLTNRC